MIQIAGSSTSDFSALNVLGTANVSGYLKPVLLNALSRRLVNRLRF